MLSGGPIYLKTLLDPDDKYKGPYKDKSKDKLGLKAIETPDAKTIVFKLPKANGDFEQMLAMPSASPVRQDKDTKSKYGLKPFSNGPYKFQSYTPNKKLTLVRNPEWKNSDTIRKALPGQDHRHVHDATPTRWTSACINGDYDLDINATGCRPGRSKSLLKEHKANVDNPHTGLHPLRGLPADGEAVRQHRLPQGRASTARTTSRSRPPAVARCRRRHRHATCCRRPSPGSDTKYDPYGRQRQRGNAERGQGQGRAEDVRQAERLQDHHRGPQQQAGRGRHRRVAAGVAEEGRHQGRDRPVRRRRRPPASSGLPEVVKKKGYGIIIMGWGADFPTGQGFSAAAVGQPVHPPERQQQLRQ